MSAQVWLDTNLVPLRTAVLCANCELISEGLNGHCCGCGSQSLLSLSRVLGEAIQAERSIFLDTSTGMVCDDKYICALSATA